ncbi:MAG: hypothetical protein RI990_14 [Planctomycetota bacterium]
MIRSTRWIAFAMAAGVAAAGARGEPADGVPAMDGAAVDAAPAPVGPPSPPVADDVSRAVEQGIAFLLGAQEGEGNAEWPYEGVYRVRGRIPIGYRIGGTGIVAEALVLLPGFATDARRKEAVARACRFVCDGIREPLMNPEYDAGYDVRGWGYCYGARMLLALRAGQAVPPGMADTVDAALRWYLEAIERTEIPQVGGWNYARQPGIDTPCPMSPFMTAPCLAVLFEAKRQGLEVDAAVVDRALAALERCRTGDGNFAYSAERAARDPARTIPGAIGRMTCGEATLMRAGRAEAEDVRRAVRAFLDHWRELEKRRQQQGTHVPPYGVAPYYFFFGFWHAADAVELLPEEERPDLRRQLAHLLFMVRDADGTWDDRVFPRSRNFGTAMALTALLRPALPEPARWDAPPAPVVPATEGSR